MTCPRVGRSPTTLPKFAPLDAWTCRCTLGICGASPGPSRGQTAPPGMHAIPPNWFDRRNGARTPWGPPLPLGCSRPSPARTTFARAVCDATCVFRGPPISPPWDTETTLHDTFRFRGDHGRASDRRAYSSGSGGVISRARRPRCRPRDSSSRRRLLLVR
jgi:hypothetical protein